MPQLHRAAHAARFRHRFDQPLFRQLDELLAGRLTGGAEHLSCVEACCGPRVFNSVSKRSLTDCAVLSLFSKFILDIFLRLALTYSKITLVKFNAIS